MIAIIFSLGMAFVAESLDDSFKTPEEIEKYLDLPVLGAVPSITKQIRKAS
jgi:capsular polysaccharide biosynthesis protein